MWGRVTALYCSLLAAVAGCGAAKKDVAGEPVLANRCASRANQGRVKALIDERRSGANGESDYVLAPGDLVVITIHHYRVEGGDFSSDVRVGDRGYVSLPMLDPIRAAGRSLADLRRAIVYQLRTAGILNEPLVSAFLKEYQGQQVVVMTAVARPGIYALARSRRTLLDVLSMAGGLAPNAGNYVLFRPAPSDVGPDARLADSRRPKQRDNS